MPPRPQAEVRAEGEPGSCHHTAPVSGRGERRAGLQAEGGCLLISADSNGSGWPVDEATLGRGLWHFPTRMLYPPNRLLAGFASKVPRPSGTHDGRERGNPVMSCTLLSVSAGLAAVSVVAAGLFVSHGFPSRTGRDRQASTVTPLSRQQRSATDAEGQSIRTVYPGPKSGPAQRSTPLQDGTAAEPASPAAASAVASSSAPLPGPDTLPQPAPPQEQADSTPVTGATTEPSAASPSSQQAPAGPGVDLNTASVEELNALGAGMIGRRIIAFRPCASPEDLVTKRVLKRSDFEIIKAAVTAR